jgi:hypothetical protein
MGSMFLATIIGDFIADIGCFHAFADNPNPASLAFL